jgi:hypothetical protein
VLAHANSLTISVFLPPTSIQDASGQPLKPSFAVLAQASSSAKSWPITSPVRIFIDDAVARTGDWMERCRKLLAKRNTGARLDACLDAVAASVDGAVEQFERRLDVSGCKDQSLQLIYSSTMGAPNRLLQPSSALPHPVPNPP